MLNISNNNPSGFNQFEQLNSMSLLNTPKTAKNLAFVLVGVFAFSFIVMFLPWQQNIYADGTVTALTPQDRPQTVESQIAGRIEHWHVREGQFVNKGEIIMDISEVKEKFFDPELLIRMKEQKAAKTQGIEATKNKIQSINNQIDAINNSMKFSLQKARNKVKQVRLKVTSDSTDFNAEKINYSVAQQQFSRQETLYKQGLKSLTELEQRKLKLQESSAKVVSVNNKYLATKNELLNAQIELNSIEAEYTDKVSKANSELSSAKSYLADATSEYSKLRNEIANVEMRRSLYSVRAPQDGHIVRILKQGIGEMIKEGEAICTVMPNNPAMAVELYVKAMDVPLITQGRKVRMEFAGWPALQFSGWPSVSVGTFGGVIDVIDYVDSKEGKYRILVRPDHNDDPWPKQIRVGSGVKGWAMLDEVSIWFEIWRQLNGFPPSLKDNPYSKAEKYYEQNQMK